MTLNDANYFAGSLSSSGEDERPLLESMYQGASTANLVEGGTKYPQFLATFIATIGGFSMGTMLAWSSPVQECIESGKYGFPTSVLEFSLIGAFLSIGAMVGALGCSSVCNYIGRKKTMISLVCPAVVGSGLILWAQNAYLSELTPWCALSTPMKSARFPSEAFWEYSFSSKSQLEFYSCTF